MKKGRNLIILSLGLLLSFNLFSCKSNNDSASNVTESNESTSSSNESSNSSVVSDVYDLEVLKSKIELFVGEEEQLEVVLTKNGVQITEGISFETADKSIVSVDENGKVVALKEGNTIITIKAYEQVKMVEVTILAPEIFLLLDKDNLKLNVNETYKLTPSVNYGNLPELTYTSFNEDIASVSDDGLISALKEGETTIKVSASEELYATCQVVVSNTYELIFPEITQKEWYVGDIIDINAIVKVNGISTKEGIVVEVDNNKAIVNDNKVTLLDDGVISIDVSYSKSNEKITQTITAYNKVSTIEDYNNIKNDLNGFYKLANDIDFNNTRVETIAHYADGYQSENNGFSGIFDGQGYSLMNMSYGYQGKTFANCAAFGLIAKNGLVKNVNFINVTLDNRISGSVATINYGTIENCFVECNITYNTTSEANNPLGGIASKNNGTIKNSVSIVNILVENNINVGAIVGRNFATGTITNCYSLAVVGVTESAKPTNNPTTSEAGKITNSEAFKELSLLNEKVKSLSEMWNVKDGKYPHLNDVDYNINIDKLEYNTYPGYDVYLEGIDSKTSYSLKIKEDIAGVSLENNKVIISKDVVINSKIIVIVANNYGGEDQEITINVNEPLVTVDGPEQISFNLNNKTSSLEDYRKLNGLTFKKGNQEYDGKYSLVSSDETIFEIDGNYVVAKNPGSATLSVIVDETVVYTMSIHVHITYVIQSVEEFLSIGTNSKTMSYDYILDNDLDFKGAQIKAFSSYWSNETQGLVFSGTFDGQGHTISNFMPMYNATFHKDGKSDRDISIFGYLTKDAVVKNVNFAKVKLSDRSSVVSSYSYGTIENVYIEASYIKYGGINRTATNPGGVIVSKMMNGVIKNCIVSLDVASDASIYAVDNTTICVGSFVGAANGGQIIDSYSICQDDRLGFYSINNAACTLTNASKYANIEEFYNNANLESFTSCWNFDATHQLYPSINGIALNIITDSEYVYNGIEFDLSVMVNSLVDIQFSLKDENENILINGTKLLTNNIEEDTIVIVLASNKYSLPVEFTLTIKNMSLICNGENSMTFDFIQGESKEEDYTKPHNIKVVYENGTEYEGNVVIKSSNENIAIVVGENIIAVGDGNTTITVEALGVVIKEISISSIMYNPIKTKDEFLAIGTNAQSMSKKYKLMNDIDFENSEIQTFSSYASRNTITWKGIFDGQGYSLKNFTVTKATNPASYDVGIFGYMSKGSIIKNTNFINATISNRGSVIAAWVEGIVENCFVEINYSEISGETNANNPSGGAVAKIATGGIVQNIVVKVNYATCITNFTYTGGIASLITAKDGYLKNSILICENPNANKVLFKNGVSTEEANTENIYQYLNLTELVDDTLANTTSLKQVGFEFTNTAITHNGVVVYTTNI